MDAASSAAGRVSRQLDQEFPERPVNAKRRLIVVSNRLPIAIKVVENKFNLQPSSGGLMSALLPILRDRCGHWVGCTGTDYHETSADLIQDYASNHNHSFAP